MQRRIVFFAVVLTGLMLQGSLSVLALVAKSKSVSLQNDPEMVVAKESSWFSISNIVGLVLIILLLFYILFDKMRRDKKEKKDVSEQKRLKYDLEKAMLEIEHLKKKRVDAERELEQSKSQVSLLNDEKEYAQKTEVVEEPEPVHTMEWDKPEAPKKLQEVFYSRYADLIDGFSVSELLHEEGNDTIFEITVFSPNKAHFRVVTNVAAQRYALSNAPYFLEQTCRYDTLPSGSNMIINEGLGLLTLLGGKWEIKEQVKISFR